MFTIRPNDFYRCIMSPNMMLARTRPLPIQQGPFFLFLRHISACNCVGFSRSSQLLTDVSSMGIQCIAALLQTEHLAKNETQPLHTLTVYAQSAPRAAGRDILPPFCCGRSGQENQPATR
ncbi:hypothetical protein DPX84_13880 [Salmonella enterica]|uniref:Uncharacterized protein n=1 Tax=Salmonella enterica TaxID=28901 RepID=A0A5T8WL36_SALER|nr:hypothetical protein [Salmonella enterica subsp. arizonae]EAO9509211.1 hypothetical protein [Salmonella enterica]EAW1457858.1 hypothetical protein [Salmonella enterica subsp. arizonae]EBJ1771499.1 hypothetical protein [Salmonella enterica]EBK8910825.1 hypothetical protein [Salmonella enterica]